MKTMVAAGDMQKELLKTAATGADYFMHDNADHRVTLLLQNTNATQNATVTLQAGDGMLAGRGDIAVTAAAGKTVAVPMSRAESARVKKLFGNDRGKVLVGTAVDAGGSVSAVMLAVISVA